MNSFVLDCSVTMAWCFRDKACPRTDAIMESLAFYKAIAPIHWSLEVANVLATCERRGRATNEQITQFLDVLKSFPIHIDHSTAKITLDDILPLARRHRQTAYDAAYLELALRTGHPLASLDDSLNKAATALGVELFNG